MVLFGPKKTIQEDFFSIDPKSHHTFVIAQGAMVSGTSSHLQSIRTRVQFQLFTNVYFSSRVQGGREIIDNLGSLHFVV